MKVTATDADDPTYGNSARVVYSILHGQPYFSVDPKTGKYYIANNIQKKVGCIKKMKLLLTKKFLVCVIQQTRLINFTVHRFQHNYIH